LALWNKNYIIRFYCKLLMNKVRTSKEYSSLQLHQRIEYEGTKK
jgi:hypothetical protein